MLKKIFKWLGIVLISFTLILVAVYFYVRPELPPIIDRNEREIPSFQWRRVALGEGVMSSNGSAYYPFVRKGTSNQLMIFFSGGGVAWDKHSAMHPFELSMLWTKEGYYFKEISPWMMLFMEGILAENNPDNPFNDWNFLFIPYTTADFHTGNQTEVMEAKGTKRTIHFNGRENTLKSLDWAFDQFPNPEKVLICGESAGAFGSTFWVPYVANQYRSSKIYHYADGAMLESPKLPQAAEELWNANWEENFGFTPTADLIKGAFIHNGRTLDSLVTFLHSNSLYDEILIQYQAKINEQPEAGEKAIQDWSSKMLRSTQAIQSAVPTYYYYLTDYQLDPKTGKTPHTFSRKKDLFYEVTEDNVRLVDWLSEAIIHDKPRSIGKEFLQGY
ncbi:MAG: pectin acetylesterase-family hydrolase [Bacteroidota bacterium]